VGLAADTKALSNWPIPIRCLPAAEWLEFANREENYRRLLGSDGHPCQNGDRCSTFTHGHWLGLADLDPAQPLTSR
jgi:hypothetical protein